MYVNLTDPSIIWFPSDLVPVTEPYSEEEFPDGKYFFGGDGYSVEFGDSGTFFDSDEILGKSLGQLLDTVPDISLLYVIAQGSGGYVINGSSRSERFYSSAGDDLIRGGAGQDEIWAGREYFDETRPDDGDDIMIGGRGADGLHGGTGSDLFVFNSADGAFTDEITAFSAADAVLVQTALADKNGDGIIAFGGNGKCDLANGGAIRIFTDGDQKVRALEFDGTAIFEGVSYYVYSLVGSGGTLALVQDHF